MSAQRDFADLLVGRVRSMRTSCIVGIDPDLARMPPEFVREVEGRGSNTHAMQAEVIEQFSAEIIEAVHDLVSAVKPQAAYFERWGAAGMAALERIIQRARQRGFLVILDAKRATSVPPARHTPRRTSVGSPSARWSATL